MVHYRVHYLDTFFPFQFHQVWNPHFSFQQFQKHSIQMFTSSCLKKNLILTVVLTPFLFSIAAAEYTVEYSPLAICNTSAEKRIVKNRACIFTRGTTSALHSHILSFAQKTVALGIFFFFFYLFPQVKYGRNCIANTTEKFLPGEAKKL